MTLSELSPLSESHEETLRSLIRAITRSQGLFSLILARCNYRTLRDRVYKLLREQIQVSLQEVDLTPQTQSLYTAIRKTLADEPPTAIIVSGLETVENLDNLLRLANQTREQFRNNLPCPLVIWVTDDILNRLIRNATDFESWASITLEFESDLEALTQFILETADNVFAQLLDSRENEFLDSEALDLGKESPLRAELQAACEEINRYLTPLPAEVEASSQFLLGRATDNNEEKALHHYERSLELWQQVGNLERAAHVQFYIGFWWGNYAVRHSSDRATGLAKSREHLEATLVTFEQIEQPERVAQFINYLGEVLYRQKDWSALKALASKAYFLHHRFCNYFRQAKALGAKAAVALAEKNWRQTEYLAKEALDTWRQAADLAPEGGDLTAFLNWENHFHRPWYLYFLGTAQRHRSSLSAATENLEMARDVARPSYDPDLYTYILDELREIYFSQGDYLKAYKTRHLRREIQSQFNLRPFIGPGRLQANQRVTNPSLPSAPQGDQIAPEIESSARAKDIENILQRVERKDFCLTIIYGPSGVGKSSILQAGLIPALQHRTFEGRPVITVSQQIYHNWSQELASQLVHACQETGVDMSEVSAIESPDDILQQLRVNEQQHFKTVLIFDQFEEFFFANPNVEERYHFYDFAAACLKILDVEIILSMKEDHLHFLLVCNRLSGLEIIDNNILDKKILYYIGNFTKEETYEIVKHRTEHTRIKFDDDLIDQMVRDLADAFDQIRPIELQIIGAQLQSDQITTLEAYQKLAKEGDNSKQILVDRYLEDVVDDCGPENEELAEILLYLLTSEDGTRPNRTKSDLLQEKLCELSNGKLEQIDLILEIFVRAGIVLIVPASSLEIYQSCPLDSYQLVHDYLVSLIRDKVQKKHQKKIADLETKVEGLGKRIRFLSGVLLVFLSVSLSVGSLLYLLYRNNKLLYQVTQLERDSIENQSQFEGYQLLSLEKAVQVVERFGERPALKERTTLPIHTLQTLLDRINEKRGIDTDIQIFAADFSPQSQQVATAGLGQTVKVWDLNRNLKHRIDLSAELEEFVQIWDVRFSSEGDRLAIIDSTGRLMLWTLATDTPEMEISVQAHNSDRFLTRLVSSSDKSVFATAGDDGRIKLWNAEDLDLLGGWSAHPVSIGSLQFSPDDERLISAGYDGRIRSWAVENTDELGTLQREFSLINPTDRSSLPPITFGLAVSSDGEFLAAASEDGLVRMWNLTSGEFLHQFSAHEGNWVTAVTFMPEAQMGTSQKNSFQVVTADEQGTMRAWAINPTTANDKVSLKASRTPQELGGHQGWVWNLLHTSESEAEDALLISTGIDGTLRFWNLREASQRQDSSFVAGFAGHQNQAFDRNQAWSISYSHDRKLLATSGTDDTAKIWQLTSDASSLSQSEPSFTLKHENSPVTNCAALENSKTNKDVFWVVFSPEERLIATAGADCTVRLWNSETGEPHISEDGDGTQRPVIMPHESDAAVYSVAFNPTGDLIASSDSRGRLFLWNTDGQPLGKPLSTAQLSGKQPQEPVFTVKFSPDGEYVATASRDGTVKLWALERSGEETQIASQPTATLLGHDNGATSVDFSRDGLIATAGRDGVIRIWEMASVLEQASFQSESLDFPEIQPTQELFTNRRRITWVEFRQTDEAAPELLATASKDGSVIIWDRHLEDWGLRQPGNTFKPKYQFSGHEEGAFSVTFLENGQQIAVAEGNGDIKMWKLENPSALVQRACRWLDHGPITYTENPKPRERRWPWQPAKDPDISEICGKYE